jgi:hypothetical protein
MDASDMLTASIIVLMIEVISNSETSANLYETTQFNIPESCHLVTGLYL